jgi:hypothetical protein
MVDNKRALASAQPTPMLLRLLQRLNFIQSQVVLPLVHAILLGSLNCRIILAPFLEIPGTLRTASLTVCASFAVATYQEVADVFVFTTKRALDNSESVRFRRPIEPLTLFAILMLIEAAVMNSTKHPSLNVYWLFAILVRTDEIRKPAHRMSGGNCTPSAFARLRIKALAA